MDLSLLVKTGEAALSAQLAQLNEKTAGYGLILTQQEITALCQARTEALRDTGRIELGESILPRLIQAFADSPYLMQENYAQTLMRLQELFYSFKNAAGERLSDDELLSGMRRVFNGRAGGEPEYLAGLTPQELWTAEKAPEGFEWDEN